MLPAATRSPTTKIATAKAAKISTAATARIIAAARKASPTAVTAIAQHRAGHEPPERTCATAAANNLPAAAPVAEDDPQYHYNDQYQDGYAAARVIIGLSVVGIIVSVIFRRLVFAFGVTDNVVCSSVKASKVIALFKTGVYII